METTSVIEDYRRNEDDLKNEDDFKNEENLKTEDDHKSEDNLKLEDNLKNEDNLGPNFPIPSLPSVSILSETPNPPFLASAVQCQHFESPQKCADMILE